MPRNSVVLSTHPVTGDEVVAAAAEVWQRIPGLDADADAFIARPLDDGAGLQVLAGEDLLLTVTRPRPLPTADEVTRLLPSARMAFTPTWWCDVFTPFGSAGDLGVVIVDRLAERLGGTVVHSVLTGAELADRARRLGRTAGAGA